MAPLSVHSWLPGTRVGRYALVRELARGGMGEIWLALDGERQVVLKRLLAGADADVDAMKMFLDEARIAAQLHHPNIVEVFELGLDAGSVFLAMEYLAGQTVSALARRLVASEGRVPEALAVQLVAEAARGLGFAHRKRDEHGRPLGIVHRDVSPQNLFVTYDGEVKVLDFGIARAAGRMVKTATGIIKGKVAYMSPEQASGGALPITGAADVYALGVVLFELVTGTRLHPTKDDLMILRRLALMSAPPAPSERGPVEPALERLIVRALAPEQAARFADAQALCEALEAWLRAHPAAPGAADLRATMGATFAQERQGADDEARAARRAESPSMPDLPAVARPPPVSLVTTPASPGALKATAAAWRNDVANQRTLLAPSGHAAKTLLVPPAPASRRPPWSLFATGGVLLALTLGAAGWLIRSEPGSAQVAPEALAPAPAAVEVLAAAVEPPRAVEDPGEPEASGDEVPPPPPPPPPEPEPEAHRAATARPTGRLSLDTTPWTRVFWGKRSLGETPLLDLALPAGKHSLRLLNPEERIDRVIEVTIEPRQTTVKKLSL